MAIILIVEDDLLTLDLTSEIIQEWGHQTLLAADVEEALLILRSPQPIDILFTDVYLKAAVHGGCDIAREAIKLRPSLRVLYTTGNALTFALRSLFIVGTDCLRKPYTDLQLHTSIDGLVAA